MTVTLLEPVQNELRGANDQDLERQSELEPGASLKNAEESPDCLNLRVESQVLALDPEAGVASSESGKCLSAAKGRGSGGPKRNRKVSQTRVNAQEISKPEIRRLARRGGVRRMSGLVYDEARSALEGFLRKVLRDAITYTEYAGRKTVTPMDVVCALKHQGITLYGFGLSH